MKNKQSQMKDSDSVEDPLLNVSGLTTHYSSEEGTVRAVEDVNFQVGRGETIGLVGESGCGKTTLGLSLLRGLPPQGDIVGGSIELDNSDITALDKKEMKSIQWSEISMIYQGAADAFNPVKTIGQQIKEPLKIHDIVPKSERDERVADLLTKVNLNPEDADKYPHELSGGMKQRAAIAMAICCEPDVLIADEPTTALDVIVQSKVLKMLKDLQKEFNFAMIVISHNISTIVRLSDRVGVMYAGNLIELAPPTKLYDNPSHPYGAKLLNSVIDPRRPPKQVENIPGEPPDLRDPPSGCKFAPRCELATSECHESMPELEPITDEESDHSAACYHKEDVKK